MECHEPEARMRMRRNVRTAAGASFILDNSEKIFGIRRIRRTSLLPFSVYLIKRTQPQNCRLAFFPDSRACRFDCGEEPIFQRLGISKYLRYELDISVVSRKTGTPARQREKSSPTAPSLRSRRRPSPARVFFPSLSRQLATKSRTALRLPYPPRFSSFQSSE